jgi:kynurenine 3-monooxygenase
LNAVKEIIEGGGNVPCPGKNIKMKKALVIGGGLVGALHAANLSKKGYSVKVYERRPDMRNVEMVAGKSINLALSTRGWKAIDMVGLGDKIRQLAIPMHGRRIHDMQGNVGYQPYGKEGQAIYSVSRGELNVALLNKAEKDFQVEMHFEWKCTGVDFEKSVAHFEHSATGEQRTETADLIFGTDGAFSQVRADMQRTPRFNYQQEFIPHGYRELLLPAGPNGSFLMDKNALHIWPRGGYMLIALPNPDGSFTCTLFMPYEGKHSFAALDSDERIDAFFKEIFPDFYEMIPNLIENYHSHPLSDLVIIRCFPWVRNRTCIMGDASHAIVPFYGQGMNSGFEDCSVMNELIDRFEHDWDEILPRFEVLRKPDADAIAELAMRNYVEMRDLVGDPQFLLQKKIEAKIHEKHPDKWTPLYTQVTFSHTRYSEALAEGKRQDRIMAEIMNMPDIEHIWDSDEVEHKILAANAL